MQRTHRIDLYAPRAMASHEAEDAWGRPTSARFAAPALATAVECNLQPQTGKVEQMAAGREAGATWKGFAPKAAPVAADQLAVVTAVREGGAWVTPPASHPIHMLVEQVGYQGGQWDTEFWLSLSSERVEVTP